MNDHQAAAVRAWAGPLTAADLETAAVSPVRGDSIAAADAYNTQPYTAAELAELVDAPDARARIYRRYADNTAAIGAALIIVQAARDGLSERCPSEPGFTREINGAEVFVHVLTGDFDQARALAAQLPEDEMARLAAAGDNLAELTAIIDRHRHLAAIRLVDPEA